VSSGSGHSRAGVRTAPAARPLAPAALRPRPVACVRGGGWPLARGVRGLGCAADGRRRNGRRDTRAPRRTTTPYASSRPRGQRPRVSRWWCWPGSARGNATSGRSIAAGADRLEVSVGLKDSRFITSGWAAAAAGTGDTARDEGHRLLYVAATRPATTSWSVCHIPTASTLATATHRSCWPCRDDGRAARSPGFAAFRCSDNWARRRRRSRAGVGARECRGARHVACGARRADRVDAGAAVLSATAIAARAHARSPIDGADGITSMSTPMPMSMSTRSSASTFRRRRRAVRPRRRRSVGAALLEVGPCTPCCSRSTSTRPATSVRWPRCTPAPKASASERGKSRVWRSQRSMRRSSGRLGDPHGGGASHRRRASAGRPAGRGLCRPPVRGRRRPADRRRLQDRRGRRRAELDAAVERYRLQLAAYALAVAGATGRPVDRAVLVFARDDGPAVEREVPDLPAAVKEAAALATD